MLDQFKNISRYSDLEIRVNNQSFHWPLDNDKLKQAALLSTPVVVCIQSRANGEPLVVKRFPKVSNVAFQIRKLCIKLVQQQFLDKAIVICDNAEHVDLPELKLTKQHLDDLHRDPRVKFWWVRNESNHASPDGVWVGGIGVGQAELRVPREFTTERKASNYLRRFHKICVYLALSELENDPSGKTLTADDIHKGIRYRTARELEEYRQAR